MPVSNFNAGPAVLPRVVLERAQSELLDYQGRGMSILEMSHRSKEYESINKSAETRFKALLGLGDDYRVLLMQGGASTQFALLALNFLRPGTLADYVITGSWGEKALEEARRIGEVHVAATMAEGGYRKVPSAAELHLSEHPTYLHLTSNETIQGVQWAAFPESGEIPLVADMSSDILSRPFDATKFSLIYAGAQKNIGPAGVTVVLIQQHFLDQARAEVPTIFSYKTHAKNNSLYNTPPVFAVYMLDLVLGWIESLGGLTAIAERNAAKAGLIYAAIDQSNGFYQGHAETSARSQMNVTFRLADEALEKPFLAEAQGQGMVGLAGHRSVGGVRASIYNALEHEACADLAQFMSLFAQKHG